MSRRCFNAGEYVLIEAKKPSLITDKVVERGFEGLCGPSFANLPDTLLKVQAEPRHADTVTKSDKDAGLIDLLGLDH